MERTEGKPPLQQRLSLAREKGLQELEEEIARSIADFARRGVKELSLQSVPTIIAKGMPRILQLLVEETTAHTEARLPVGEEYWAYIETALPAESDALIKWADTRLRSLFKSFGLPELFDNRFTNSLSQSLQKHKAIAVEDLKQKFAARDQGPSGDTPSSSNTFGRDGDTWHMTFEGEETRITDLKGLSYIHHLLSHPGKSVTPMDLIRILSPPPSMPQQHIDAGDLHTTTSSLDAIDEQTLKDARKQISDYDRQIDSPETPPQLKELLSRERQEYLEYLQKNTSLGSRIRRANDDEERARSAVTQAVKRAVSAIKEKIPALGEHLEDRLQTGSSCTYFCPPETTWKT